MESANTHDYFSQPFRTMKNFLLLFILSLLSATTHSQAVSWELSAEPGNQALNNASFENANFDNCFLTRGAGVGAVNGAGSMNSSDWFSDNTPTTLDQAIDDDDFYEFTIETINCFFFNPTTIKIVLRSSATGPNKATLRCSSDGFTANIGTVTVTTASTVFSFSETISPNSQSVTYRLYGYGTAAGGGNPSAGGTMRIGTSIVASDNDLEVFASTTLLQVTAVPDISVFDGDAVPATIFTSNVPGATMDWSRTLENFGLVPTSGTGNLPTFNAFNASGVPITSTFTVNAILGSCESVDEVFTLTVNPDPCTITVDFFGNPSACNDNGTPNDPSDDFFTQNIHASFFNRPGTGELQIVPGGDQIGTYSIPVNQIIGNSHLFNSVKLKADGTPSVVQMNFTDDPGCIDADTGPTVQPCSSGGQSCEIIGFSFNNIGSCNDNGTSGNSTDDFFTVDVDVIYSNSYPSGAQLRFEGADVIVAMDVQANIGINLTHTFVGAKLRADGQITDIVGNMSFAGPVCSLPGTGPAVNSCSSGGGGCSIDNVVMFNKSDCDNNGTPNDITDDFYTADLVVTFENPPTTGNLMFTGDDIVPVGFFAFAIANVLAVGSPATFNNKPFRADGQPTTFLVEFTGAPGCEFSFTGPGVDFCSSVFTCPPNVTVECSGQGSDINGVTSPCAGDATVLSISQSITNQICSNNFDNVLTYRATDLCGNDGTCTQTITVRDVTPPTVSCPAPLTVSCASQVPAADASLIGVSDNCAGLLGITRVFVGETTSNQSCANRFTLTRTYKGGDDCGNTATCSQTITVNDQTPPSLTCPVAQTVSCASQVPVANTTLVTGLSDNCSGATPTVTFINDVTSNQTCANRFTVTRRYRATDACGNSASCSQTITVNDQTGPTLTCPAPQTVSCAEQVPAANPALVTGTDNCGGGITPSFFSNTTSNQTCANRFTVTRQYRAADVCGNTSSCNQIITVNDQTPPVFTSVPANVTVDCYLIPGVGIATASDNCTSGATVVFLGETEVPGICPVWKILTRTWRATDVCGNSATASQVVSVTDFNAPQFLVLPKNKVVECGQNNQAEFQAFIDDFGAAIVEDCAEITYTHADSPVQHNYFDCGNTFHKNIRFFATDECGNVSFRDASFRVQDLTPPVFSTPPQNIDIECDASDDNGENAFYDWLDSNAGLVVEDNCGSVELEKIKVSEYAGCGNTWRKTYEFYAKDECGNISKITATFAVVDYTPPTLVCPPNDNTAFLACVEDVPDADPTALSAYDCSGVTLTLKDTWTNGTGCPGWMMTVAYRYAATDGCGNEAICEQAFYVEETDTPTLICPDTIHVVCVNDIPGPAQLFGYIKTKLAGNCAGGFSSIRILSDSGQPQNGSTHRTYTFKAKNRCGKFTSTCSVTFHATGSCNQLCTASQGSWGDPNGTVGGMATADALQILLAQYGPVKAGGGNHILSASDAACVQEMLFGSGTCEYLPTGQNTCPLPNSLANPDGSLNNQLAANALALQLNIWYNLHFNNRDFGIQNLHNLPPCLAAFSLVKDLAQNSTVQDLLNLSNQYLQGLAVSNNQDLPAMLNSAMDNLNHFRTDCGLNAPCERPVHGRTAEETAFIQGLKLSPNPAIDAVTLRFESTTEGEVGIQIGDGRVVQMVRNVQAVKGLNQIDISVRNLPAGVYSVSLQSGTSMETLRLVKVDD